MLQSKTSCEIYIFNFGYVSPGHYIYVSNDVWIRGYLLKPVVVMVGKIR